MTDYPALYRRLAREILAVEANLTADTAAFAAALIQQLRRDGYTLSQAAADQLNQYGASMQAAMTAAIAKSAAIGAGDGLQSPIVQRIAAESFAHQWPNGLTLSDSLWHWETGTRRGVSEVLQAGIQAGRAVDGVVMDMQRTIERGTGRRFKIVSEHADDWVKSLYEAGRALIHDPSAKAEWDAVVADARGIIESLAESGSRRAAERVFDQLTQAVGAGKEAAMDKAVKWWTYDKQLFNLKRIARTEMANAGHRAVIESTIHDETILGYEWRLSSTHPVTDICDYYASIDMGLGKGIFTKAAVPRSKAHPHCMCLLIPRVTPNLAAGSKTYGDWLSKLPAKQRDDVLPAWAAAALKKGVAVDKLVRADGMGLVRESEVI
ncbi:hypothetical protein HC024_00205 [Methylococcaceae bacterium WWC4]|nr:hypothetical protein [Methylococcaceae bacterium WWC4]